MSVNLNALKEYKSVDLRATVETASPHKLISMLLEGALTALAQAKGAIERKQIQDRTESLNKATDIIVGLKGSLDHETGGEMAANLDELYNYMIRQVVKANRENSAETVQEVMDLILEVRSGWASMPVEVQIQESNK
ncbi:MULTISPECIES: flagellar export chaperone FliS [unclassified Neptuniibacter]|uniref:flagellar export chaperone FliS n=1 Tax=unclassified Neptuniibacter TaxID=2630693 RepID=UPI000C691602|nr:MULTISPECIES: flagellar export chaperone FliS [unclassified Neptuniibacter]MAY40947.1 flagellar export chaperone FliS [Oceanospirillaceae bacterium]|tara:strand:- start:34517 stop:34927 length:411 start_codon:yes stop_codon:yes gene_type:complete